MSAEIKPYRISVGDDVLDDLKSRLRKTRWPEAELVDDWSQGAPLKWIKDVCRYWAEEYDWREREARLNRFAQFTTEIDGLDIHFLHVRSPHPEAMPLIITHGWPGSIVEFHKVIEPLTDPTAHGGNAADAFHVVCPSLPGFGFSAKPTTTGWGVDRIASSLGGADGSPRLRALRRAGRRLGLGGHDRARRAGCRTLRRHSHHARDVGAAQRGRPADAGGGAGAAKGSSTTPTGIPAIPSSNRPGRRPSATALTDSPSGQAAWILEKFWAWTDCDGHPENILGRDELLDNVMLYWVTATAASSARLYWESFGPKRRTAHKVTVPTGVAVFPKEIVTPVRKWMEASYTNIRHWSEMPKGGHFAAFEQPELFVQEVREFFRTLR